MIGAGAKLVGKLIRLPLKLVPALKPMRILSGPLAGKRWLSTSGTHGCWLGTYEIGLQRELAKVLGQGDVFYDIGANVGFFSLLAATRGARVVAFEPLERNVELLGRNMALNHLGDVVMLVQSAVARESGKALFASERSASMGQLSSTHGVEVSVLALDDFIAAENARAPTVIKMDIEGAESEALVGAQELLRTHRPAIYLSTHGWQQNHACWSLLESLGYRMELRKDGARDGQYEVVARATPLA
ncbi:MAG: FkbM family methyltransferase [Pseudomonadota bacterium]